MKAQCEAARFDENVHRLTRRFLALWEEVPQDYPELAMRFTPRQQAKNERSLDRQLWEIPASLAAYEQMPMKDRLRMRSRVRKAVTGLPWFTRDPVRDRFFDASERVTWSFVDAARDFDPGINEDEIQQALRNLWVFNSIQLLLGRSVLLTPSSFAYSLLYPYTDNGLDGEVRTPEEKRTMVEWLTRWFKGEPCVPTDGLTKKVGGLLQMVEREYPRSLFPNVHYSLHAIHRAQQKSLVLHDVPRSSDDAGLLSITLEKGGASVLADGYLAAGRLTPAQAEALFGYGVFLQLIDDLQDLDEDVNPGHSTPFGRAREDGLLDDITSRLIHFTRRCVVMLKDQASPGSAPIDRVIEQSGLLLVAEAVARYRIHYSDRFLEHLGRSLPLGLAYLGEMKQNVKKRQVSPCRVTDNTMSIA